MKQRVEITDQNSTESVQKFITIWKERKNYQDEGLTLGQVIELLTAVTYTFYQDDSDGRFFNNLLQNEESTIGWDGVELIDILFYEAVKHIKERIGRARTFNDTIDYDTLDGKEV